VTKTNHFFEESVSIFSKLNQATNLKMKTRENELDVCIYFDSSFGTEKLVLRKSCNTLVALMFMCSDADLLRTSALGFNTRRDIFGF
jgi:hypothetical protein